MGGALDRRWGEGSPAARRGDQRYFAAPLPELRYIFFNASRPPFVDRDVRRAAALALDRESLAAVWSQIEGRNEMPSDQLLPPVMPGFEDKELYPLDGSAIERARKLMRGRTGTAVMPIDPASPCGSPCVREAQVIRADLARIGIRVRLERLHGGGEAASDPHAKIDIAGNGFPPEPRFSYADSAEFVNDLLLIWGVDRWLPSGVEAEVRHVKALEGAERQTAAADLADRLATHEVPIAAESAGVVPSFLSPRLGCRVFPPFGYGVDLAALC
jgi:hypothetical protein